MKNEVASGSRLKNNYNRITGTLSVFNTKNTALTSSDAASITEAKASRATG